MCTNEQKYQEHLQKVKEDPFYLKYMPKDEQTEELCLTAVQENGWALAYVQEQTPTICLEAVRQDGWALQYVQQQTHKLCLEAVRENVKALEYVSTDYYEEVSKQMGVKLFHCQNRPIFVEKINNQWVFTVGCQVRITKETFMERIYNEDGGLAKNPHRQEYLDILKQF